MGIFVKADCIVLNGSPELLYKTGELKDQKASLNFIKTNRGARTNSWMTYDTEKKVIRMALNAFAFLAFFLSCGASLAGIIALPDNPCLRSKPILCSFLVGILFVPQYIFLANAMISWNKYEKSLIPPSDYEIDVQIEQIDQILDYFTSNS